MTSKWNLWKFSKKKQKNTILMFWFRISCDAVPCSKLEEADDIAEKFDVIGIDEGQFVSIWCNVRILKFLLMLMNSF